MEPFTFSRSVQVLNKARFSLNGRNDDSIFHAFVWLKSTEYCREECLSSFCTDFYQIHLKKVHSTTALLNGSAKSERGEYKIIIKIWFASLQSRTAQLCFPMEVCPGQGSTIRIFSACPVFGHSYCWAMQGSLYPWSSFPMSSVYIWC